MQIISLLTIVESLKAGKKQVILATNSENITIINSGSIETTNSRTIKIQVE